MELMHVLSADTWNETRLSLRCLKCGSLWEYAAVIHKSKFSWTPAASHAVHEAGCSIA